MLSFINLAGITTPMISGVPSTLPNGISGGATAINDMLKSLPPTLAVFVSNLPAVEGIYLCSYFYPFFSRVDFSYRSVLFRS